MSAKPNNTENGMLSFIVVLSPMVSSYIIVALGVISALLEAGVNWLSAIFSGICWPIFLVDIISEIVVGIVG